MAGSHRAGGVALVDLTMAIMIVGVCLMVTMQQLAISFQGHRQETEKLFTYQKAMSIYAELQVAVEQGQVHTATDLDVLADSDPNPVLTTRDNAGAPLAPDHPMSGNVRLADGSWKWYRKVDLNVVPGNPNTRYAQIRMLRRAANGQLLTDAAVGGLLNLPSAAAPAVKEYDVYVLAIATAPSLWMQLADLRELIEGETTSLSQDNPNLHYRLHWITRSGYGRNAVYTPRVNVSKAADEADPFAFWYPGTLASGSTSGQLYAADAFSGHLTTEAGEHNGYAAGDNPHPHAIADRWNHCMRSPAAHELFERRVAAGTEQADSPPLQILLDDMQRFPQRYRNAVFVNLHGEGLPCPPLRNYADAARSPAMHPGVRVVTHPARLRTPRDPDGDGDHADTEDVELRVYGYKTDPTAGPALLTGPITVEIDGIDLTSNVNGTAGSTLVIRRLPGGVNPATGSTTGSGREYFAFDTAQAVPPLRSERSSDFEMCYEVGYTATPEPRTWIRLYNTPLTAPVHGGRGLSAAQRLYGMEYVPSPVRNDPPFGEHLASQHGGARNTARWLIRIPKGPLAAWLGYDRTLTVRTRIGTDLTTGQRWPTAHDPENASVTYTWWTAAETAVPATERYQFLGDPRHNPYADVAASHGYNWFFDDLRDGGDDATGLWPCLDAARLRDGFGPGGVTADVPRLLQLWRDALQGTASVFSHSNGRLANYLLLGGELAEARDATAPRPVQLNSALFGRGGPAVGVDTLSAEHPAGALGARPPRRAGLGVIGSLLPGRASTRCGEMLLTNVNGRFWARPWLGELAPDSASTWRTTGNLPCGLSTYRLVERSTASLADLPFGTDFGFPSGSELGALGPATLLQGDPNQRLQHLTQSAENTLSETAKGLEILDAGGRPQPVPMPGRFPFRTDIGLHTEPPHTAFTATYPAHALLPLETLSRDIDHATGAAVLRLAAPGSAGTAWFVVASDTPASATEHRTLAGKTLLWALRGLHVAGESGEIEQLPQLQVVGPLPAMELLDPHHVQLVWRTPFKRFDGIQPFTSGYPGSYEGNEAELIYVVTYSRDGGAFRYVETHAPASLGVLPGHASLYAFDAGYGDELQLLELSATQFPAGTYVFRVECFHAGRDRHTSHHQVRVDIRR